MQSCINITSSTVHFLCVKHSHTYVHIKDKSNSASALFFFLYRYLHVYFAFYLMISDYAGMWASFITLSLYCMNKVNSTFLVSWMKADEQDDLFMNIQQFCCRDKNASSINPVLNNETDANNGYPTEDFAGFNVFCVKLMQGFYICFRTC